MKFRKKPVVIEAEQFTGSVLELSDKFASAVTYEARFKSSDDGEFIEVLGSDRYFIKTLEGNMDVSFGDWIIQGVHGEFYPCKPDIFQKTYESVE